MDEKYKIEYAEEWAKDHPSYLYKKRNGNIYPYFKENIKKQINPFDSNTFINILKEMDYPFIQEEWDMLIKQCLKKKGLLNTILGKYISLMQTKSFKNFTFKDSNKFKN